MDKVRRQIEAEENLVIDFQYALIDALKERGMTKEQLAKLLGVSKSRVSQWLSSSSNPTLKTVARVFDALDCAIPFTPKSVWDVKSVHNGAALMASRGMFDPCVFVTGGWVRQDVSAINDNYTEQSERIAA